jgi:hypothetical protein
MDNQEQRRSFASPFLYHPGPRCPEGPVCGLAWWGGADTTSRCPWFETSQWIRGEILKGKSRINKQSQQRLQSGVTLGNMVEIFSKRQGKCELPFQKDN